MTTEQPIPPPAAPPSYWQVPAANRSEDLILPWFRSHLVAVVAALLVQATIALLGLLPALPVAPLPVDPNAYYVSEPMSFWAQFAVIEFLGAAIVALAFAPGVRLNDVPAIGRLVLGVCFVVLPAAAIVLGGVDAARIASSLGAAATASSWLTTAFFTTIFFGLPLIALGAPAGRAKTKGAS